MKKQISLIILAILFHGCASKEPQITGQELYLNENNSIQRNDFVLDLEFEQNAWNLPSPSTKIQTNKEKFLKKYFAVWDNDKPDTTFKNVFWGLEAYKNSVRKKYYGANRRAYNDKFFEEIYDNADTDAFGKVSKPAITVTNTLLRNIPTHEPIFSGFDMVSQGYPFDQLSNSAISIGYPLFVSHFSKDGAFALVQNDVVWGWVDSRDIKFVTEQEIINLKNSNFITILNDNTAVKDLYGNFLFYARVGSLLPFKKEDLNSYTGYIKTASGQKEYKISKNDATIWPAKLTDKNIKTNIQSMLGQPYGWGGFDFYRDCSLMTKDILTTYGIWLPRNSKAQASSHKIISLKSKSNQEKLNFIKQNAIPYATLLYMPGHIMLYVGVVNDQVMVVHSVWGLKTKDERRALIAQTAITTLEIGKNRSDIAADSLLLSKITSMSILIDQDSDFLAMKTTLENYKGYNKSYLERKFASSDAIQSDATPNLKAKILEKSYGIEVKDNTVFFKDGTSTIFDDQKIKDEQEKLDRPDIEDMISFNYPALKQIKTPTENIGRIRNEELFNKIYGADENAVTKNLETIIWLKKHLDLKLKFNGQNAASKALTQVSKELDDLVSKDPRMLKFLENPAGTFKWRNIAKTGRRSAHSWGIAIDINTKFSNYWQWDKKEEFKNQIPFEIVKIFEKNGFIWGGRWEKYDTMHFEYRPELLNSAQISK